MGRFLGALAVLVILAIATAGVAMATGHGNFIKRMASSARHSSSSSDDDDSYDEDGGDEDEPRRRSPGLKAAYRRLAAQKQWDAYYRKLYGSGQDDGKVHRYCFGLKCKPRPKHDRDEESDEDEELDEE